MISILLVGVGGYGGLTARAVLENAKAHGAYVKAVVEPFIENSPVRDQIKNQNIPVFSDIKDFYRDNGADIAIISTPIHLHRDQCMLAMEKGSDVLCEKPIAPTLQDAYEMESCAKRTGRNLNIGFQLSHAPAVLNLKKDILSGSLGRLKSMYSTVCWPRNSTYFARPWAAKAKIGDTWVLDSIAMNACAHYLHNMLFLAGESMDSSAQPATLGASIFKANDIETYDTALIEVKIKDSIPLRYTVSHATKKNIDPKTRLSFEKATVYITEDGGDDALWAILSDGSKKIYGATYKDRFEKIWYCLKVFKGDCPPICKVETALPHLKCVNAVSQYFKVRTFTDTVTVDDVKTVNGLDDMLISSYENDVMPPLYKPDKLIDMAGYTSFGGVL